MCGAFVCKACQCSVRRCVTQCSVTVTEYATLVTACSLREHVFN